MGRYSYWIAELESVRTADDAARMLDAEDFGISIDHVENCGPYATRDALNLEGYPCGGR